MSEEAEQQPQDKQSALKEKLKKMGVMRDKNDQPKEHGSFITRHKLPVMFVAIVIGVLVWWSQNHNENGNDVKVAERPAMSQPYGMGGPYAPPPPPGYFRDGQQTAPGDRRLPPGRSAPPDWNAPTRADRDRAMPPPGWGTPPEWDAPTTRAEDVYGPPPGPPPPDYMYGRPYGYYGPPPPQFYGPYGPYRPYGPPPPYGNPWYGGYYPPVQGNTPSN
jgi:hypothetical protein